MNKFTKQFFPRNPMMAFRLEMFIFTLADHVIKGYRGGSWESMKAGSVRILQIPGSASEHTISVEMSGTEVTTDKLTASAAFTALAVNWFWGRNVEKLSHEEHSAFLRFHDNLRSAVYSDKPDFPFNTSDYFSLTD